MTSPTASELNQGKELLTVERVREMRAAAMRNQPYTNGWVDLCDYWLSSRSSEAPSRRGEGDKPLPFKLPAQVFPFNEHLDRWEIADGGYVRITIAEGREIADAIVEALNKNTGGAS